MLRILFLSPRQCWPPISGAKLRDYHLARVLGRHAALTYVFFSSPGAPAPELPFCRRLVAVPAPRAYTVGKIARGLVGRWPLPVMNYTSAQMQTTLAAIVADEQFDLVHIDSIHLAALLPELRRGCQAPIVYDWHNIESEAMRRYASLVESPARKLYAAVTGRRLAALEQRILRGSFGHLVCSEREREQLHCLVPRARIRVVENGVDTRYFESSGEVSDARKRIVFVGTMGYHANVEAAVRFVRTIWPGIRKRFPGWLLTLVGSDPSPAVVALRGEAGVEVTGTVDDVRPYYREALAAIVPLRTGGGTRLKILEAMAAGVPVISTSFGAEGLPVSPGGNILIADRDEDWAVQLDALSSWSDRWSSLALAGRCLVKSRYDWDAIGTSLYETYCAWTGPAER
jgi:glycosyltransferase involved in cell wall biosynthesis